MRVYSIEDRSAPFIDAYAQSASDGGYDLRLMRPDSNVPTSFSKFHSVYRHFSINPESFELACFRRYFEVLRLTAAGDRFIIADSDLLVTAKASHLPRSLVAFDHGLVGSIGVNHGIPEEDISPHFSFWTHAHLKRFVDYLISTYEQSPDRLKSTFHRRREAGNPLAAISDMTLLHMFVNDTGTPFMDSNRVIDGGYIDHNFSMAETSNERFRMELGFKAFRVDGGRIQFVTSKGDAVRPAVIHLQARAKIAASDLRAGRFLLARGRLAALSSFRQMRRIRRGIEAHFRPAPGI